MEAVIVILMSLVVLLSGVAGLVVLARLLRATNR
jgi:hypothetical protein